MGETYTFRVRAIDIFGQQSEIERQVLVSDDLMLYPLDSSNSFAHYDNIGWFSTHEKPVISFKSSRDVSSCQLLGHSQSFVGGPREFSLDLSSVTTFESSEDEVQDILIGCYDGGNLIPLTKQLIEVHSLSDFVVTSSNGFVFNEAPYETTLRVEGVGPYKHLKCSYSYEGQGTSFIPESGAESFERTIELGFSQGLKVLDVTCTDILGRSLTKSYDFEINVNQPLELSNLKLVSDFEQEANQGIFYVQKDKGYDLSFQLNKRNVACEYHVLENGNLFSGIVNFFKNLFSVGKEDLVVDEDPYVFESSTPLTFSQEEYSLSISCSHVTDGTVLEPTTYDVKVLENLNEDLEVLGVQRVES